MARDSGRVGGSPGEEVAPSGSGVALDPASVRDSIAASLDQVDQLPIGAGELDLFGYGMGTLHSGRAGAGLEYRHRLSKGWSAYAAGELGGRWGDVSELEWQARAGVRARFHRLMF